MATMPLTIRYKNQIDTRAQAIAPGMYSSRNSGDVSRYKTPAKITVQPGQAYPENGRLWVPLEITNSGGQPAARIEVEASRPSQSGEAPAAFSIDYLPRGATRKGQVSFPDIKLESPVEVRVISYQEP